MPDTLVLSWNIQNYGKSKSNLADDIADAVATTLETENKLRSKNHSYVGFIMEVKNNDAACEKLCASLQKYLEQKTGKAAIVGYRNNGGNSHTRERMIYFYSSDISRNVVVSDFSIRNHIKAYMDDDEKEAKRLSDEHDNVLKSKNIRSAKNNPFATSKQVSSPDEIPEPDVYKKLKQPLLSDRSEPLSDQGETPLIHKNLHLFKKNTFESPSDVRDGTTVKFFPPSNKLTKKFPVLNKPFTVSSLHMPGPNITNKQIGVSNSLKFTLENSLPDLLTADVNMSKKLSPSGMINISGKGGTTHRLNSTEFSTFKADQVVARPNKNTKFFTPNLYPSPQVQVDNDTTRLSDHGILVTRVAHNVLLPKALAKTGRSTAGSGSLLNKRTYEDFNSQS